MNKLNSENDKNPELLLDAVKGGHLETVEQLLKNGANVNCVSTSMSTPLHIAIDNGNKDVIKFLLEEGADVDAKEASGSRPLHLAVVKGCEEVVTLLLEKRPDVNAKEENNETPLHFDSKNGNTGIAEILLNHGANLHDFTLSEGYTPLHFASDIGNVKAIELYLNKGADINIASANDNLTPLHIATRKGHAKVVNFLLQHGAQVDRQDKDSKTVLNYAVESGNLKIVKDVLEKSPDISNQSNRNSLETAVIGCGEKSNEILKALLDYGFIFNPETVNKPKFFHAAVENGYLTIVEDLLKHGANVNMLHKLNSFDKDLTPLHTAAKHKQEEIAKLLISFKADINAKDVNEKYPIFYAIENRDFKMFQLLLSSVVNVKDDFELLHYAVGKGFLEAIETLLKCGVDVNARDEFGRTAMHYIVQEKFYTPEQNVQSGSDEIDLSDYIETEECKEYAKDCIELFKEVEVDTPIYVPEYAQIIKTLLNNGAKIDAKEKDGATALHYAAEDDRKEIVELLLENGANINLKMNNNFTPLHMSAKTDSHEVVETLLKFGADVDPIDEKGRTPLHIAAEEGYEDVVKILLKYGADLNETCSKNLTPLVYVLLHLTFLLNYPSDYPDYYEREKSKDEYRLTLRVLVIHIIKMTIANLYLNEKNNLRSIMDLNEFSDFQNKCKEEIVRLKSHKFENTNITFYDILVKDRNTLAKCMKNDDIVQALEAEEFKIIFPTYADLINLQFRKAMKRRELLTRGNNICHILLPESIPDCYVKILNYLNDDDLRNLIEACKSG